MAKETLTVPELPDAKDPAFHDLAVEACIKVFKKLQDNTATMDLVGIPSKQRALILADERYKVETKKLNARYLLDELEDIEEMEDDLKNSAPDPEDIDKYDVRDPKSIEAYTKDVKETLGMRLKVKQHKREILASAKGGGVEETNALNIYFIPCTKEEFEAFQNVEVHDGDEEASMSEEKANADLISAAVQEATTENTFFIDADGSLTS